MKASGTNAAKRCAVDLVLCLVIIAATNGCAFHYYNKETGTEHLFGFGHFRMKAPPKTDASPVAAGSQMLGLNLRTGRDDFGIGVGFDSQSRITMPTNGGTLLLEWPANFPSFPREMRSLFNVRVGTNLPPSWEPTIEAAAASANNTP
jgi:hypothetical protein